MKIFLAGIMQGSVRDDTIHPQDWRGPIREIILRRIPDAEVYCHYSEHPNSLTYSGGKIREPFDDGVRRCAGSDLVIAYLPSASMGTAIEMYEAYQNGAVVLTVTPMAANWVVRLYSHAVFATLEELDVFLADGRLEAFF